MAKFHPPLSFLFLSFFLAFFFLPLCVYVRLNTWNFFSIFPDKLGKYFHLSFLKMISRAELVFLKQYYRYYFSRKLFLIILFGVKWFSSFLIGLIISVLVVYILSFYLFSLSLHFLFILFYRPLSAFYSSSLIRSFLFLLHCVICLGSISLLPDTPWLSSFHFHDNPTTPLDCEIAFAAPSPPLSLSLSLSCFSLSPHYYLVFPFGSILLFVIKCHFRFWYFFKIFKN